MENKDKKLHIVMLPWSAFGHIIPFLELSKRLAQKGHQISFISTTRNINRLPKIPPNLSSLINLVKLSLPSISGLPEIAEATSDIHETQVPYLKKAYNELEIPVKRFIQENSPDWIIFDFTPYWVPKIAAELGIKCAYFSIFTASSLCLIGPPELIMNSSPATKVDKPEDLLVDRDWFPFPSRVSFRLHEVLRYYECVDSSDTALPDFYKLAVGIQGSDFVALRSCYEVEPDEINLLNELYKKPVVPVGLIPPLMKEKEEEEDKEWEILKTWLNKQKERSVVYIAFGSEATLSEEETRELGYGLERSGLPFFWVVRRKAGDAESDSFLAELEGQVGERGFICRAWAPQLKILAHDSVGGFLTHCGWSSVIEALGFGHALILFPVSNDQGLNARLFGSMKVGMEIPRNERDGSFTSDSVAESLRRVMVDEEGELFRAKAREMRKIFGDTELQARYVDEFAQYLNDHAH